MSQKTDALIASLSEGLAPTPPGAVRRRIAIGLGAGGLVSSILMIVWLGIRPDLAEAVTTVMFWVKFGYAAVAGVALALALERLSRPGVRLGNLTFLVAAPFILMACLGAARLMMSEPAAHHALLTGGSYRVCAFRIYIIGLPLLTGALWAVRGLAPTRLTLAGLVAGGCAGAISAVIYGFHCDETAAPFVAVWYTLGMAAVAVLGGLAGSRLLRWR